MHSAANSKAIAANRSAAAALQQDTCTTDSEAEDGGRAMYSDQESNPDRENHPPNSGKSGAPVRTAPGSAQATSGKTMRFKVVRYEEYRQKWGTKGRASVWDEHLPGVPTSLPPKTEMELRTEQNLLMCDPLPATPIPYPHVQCHQQPHLSKRSHYERIPLAMLHYPKCDQVRKPGAAGRLEVATVRADDEPSPAHRGRRRHKASLPCPTTASQLDPAVSATATPPAELSGFDAVAAAAPSAAALLSTTASAGNATATTATSDSSKVPSSSLATPPLQSQQSSQPPSRQAPPPPLPPLQTNSTTPPANLDLTASGAANATVAEDRTDDPPNPPNPPASPVPEQRQSPPTSAPPHVETSSTTSAAAVAVPTTPSRPAAVAAAAAAAAESCSVKRGRFTVAAAGGGGPPQPPAPPPSSLSSEEAIAAAAGFSIEPVGQAQPPPPPAQSAAAAAAAVSASGEVSLTAQELAARCRSHKPTVAHLFTPERVQEAFNYINRYRESEPAEESQFQVTIDKVVQTVIYLCSQDGKKKKEQIAPPNVVPVTSSSSVVGITTGGNGGGGSSSGSGNMTRSSSVETRLEARINGVTDMLQGAILSTVKSEMEPLQQQLQQYRTALQQRDAEIQALNQTLRTLLSEEAMNAILNRQSRLSRPE